MPLRVSDVIAHTIEQCVPQVGLKGTFVTRLEILNPPRDMCERVLDEVVSVERYRTLAEAASARLTALGYENVKVQVADGLAGVPEGAPYDRIIITAAAEAIPETLIGQLADGGVMVLPLGPHAGPQQLVKLTKKETGIEQEELIGVRFVPLLPGKAREL